MATWNRDVTVNSSGSHLLVTKTGGGNADPPPLPNHNPRTDTPYNIETFKADRPSGGAKIKYHAKNRKVGKGPGIEVLLTGITMKDKKPIPPELTWRLSGGPNAQTGKLLTLTDKGDTGTYYEYYVWGKAAGVDTRTRDPRIRNSGL